MGIKKGLFRVSLIMLALLFITGGILPSVGVAAAEVVKIEKTYDIAVAYDNSGSMYQNTDAWCQAKFAMEIFASMLDYNSGDKLTIFPMWEVVTDGSSPNDQEMPQALSSKPVEIKSLNDIDKIHNMFIANPGDTPISVVRRAADYLKTSSASEKWLIVLTDGIFADDETYPDYEIRVKKGQMSTQDTRKYLLQFSEDVNVQYLRLGKTMAGEEKLKGDSSRNLYSEYAESSDQLQDKLIGICNKVFQRDELVGKLSGNTLKIDISMKSIIVFVQGKGAAINSLSDKKGNAVDTVSDSGQRKYSELSCFDAGSHEWGKYEPKLAKDLYGQVVTFGACSVGAYTLDIEGADADKIKIFYEPDVDMQVDVYDKDGNIVDVQKAAINAGDYIVKAKLVDAKTGADITKSPLMGDNVKFDLKIKYEDKDPVSYPVDIDKGSTINLVPGEKIDTVVTGTYLEDYRISNEDDPSIFPGNIVVIDPEEGLVFKADVLQEDNWYQLSKNKEWKPVRVDIALDNEPLSDEQLKAIAFDITAESSKKKDDGKKLEYKIEYLEGQSAIEIHIAKNAEGKYVAPDLGNYKMAIKGTLVANTGLALTANDKVSFEIRALSKLVAWLINCAIILTILLIFLAYMNMKVLPKKIFHESTQSYMRDGIKIKNTEANVEYSGGGKSKGSLKVETPAHIRNGACRVNFTLKAVDKRWVRSRNRQIRIVEIKSAANTVSIDGNKFVKKNGKFIDKAAGAEEPIAFETNISNVEIKTDSASLKCTVDTK